MGMGLKQKTFDTSILMLVTHNHYCQDLFILALADSAVIRILATWQLFGAHRFLRIYGSQLKVLSRSLTVRRSHLVLTSIKRGDVSVSY